MNYDKIVEYVVSQIFSVPLDTRFYVLLILLSAIYFHLRFHQKAATYGPTLLTTAGIFCTFLGIALGLRTFDVKNIANSIPQLLEGLKTAFWASVFGVGSALTLKIREYFGGYTDNANAPREATINDLNKNMNLMLSALASPDGESLLSQLKLLRSDINDKLEKMRISQEKSLEKLAELGSKTLIEQLSQIIRDFNNKLTEQFGENFKKLNEAVGKMVEWQHNYKSHVEIVEKAIIKANESISISITSIQKLVENAEKYSQISDNLSKLIENIDKQIVTISENTKSLQIILENLSRSTPEMKVRIEQFVETTTQSMSSAAKNIEKMGTDTIAQIQEANTEMTKTTTELANQIRAQSKALESEIEKTVSASITTLGQQLGTLSEKFATDYTPITQAIRDLIIKYREGIQK